MEILRHIPNNPAFANVIRSLTIRCRVFVKKEDMVNGVCESGCHSPIAVVIPINCSLICVAAALCKALRALPLLESFAWYAHNGSETSDPPAIVINALSPQLRKFRAT